MRKITNYMYIAALATLFAVSSCTKEGTTSSTGSHAGEVINFGATVVSNGIETKLQYTDVTGNGTTLFGGSYTVERIDWSANYDQIRIYSNSATGGAFLDGKASDYTISEKKTSEDNAVLSVATQLNTTAPLKWAKDADETSKTKHKFIGVYPSPSLADQSTDVSGGHVCNLAVDGDNATYTIYVPYEQDQVMNSVTNNGKTTQYLNKEHMRYCYMVGTGAGYEGEEINLEFAPVVTTFDIELVNNSKTTLKVQSIALINITSTTLTGSEKALSGRAHSKFSVTDDGSISVDWTNTSVDNGLEAVKAIFDKNSADPVEVEAGKSIKATLFALPRDFTSLSLKITTDMGEAYLPLKTTGTDGDYVKFSRCFKYNIKVNIAEFETQQIPYQTLNILAQYLNYTKGLSGDNAYFVGYNVKEGKYVLVTGNTANYTSEGLTGRDFTDAEIIDMCSKITDLTIIPSNNQYAVDKGSTYDTWYITSYALSFYNNARNINFTSSNILSVDMSGLDNVMSINYHSNMGYLNISHCPELRTLNVICSSNGAITGFSNLPKLENLYFDALAGSMGAIDVQECPAFKRLFLDSNQMTSIVLDGHTNLEWVWTQTQVVTSVTASGCTNLSLLYVSSNSLTNADLSGCSSLKDAYFYGQCWWQGWSNYPSDKVSLNIDNSAIEKIYFNTGSNENPSDGNALVKGEDGSLTRTSGVAPETQPTTPTVPFPLYGEEGWEYGE